MDPARKAEGHAYSAADDPFRLPRWLQMHPVSAGIGFGLIVMVAIVTRWGWASGMAVVGPFAFGAFNWWAWRPNGCFWRMRRNIWLEAQGDQPG